MALSLTCDGLTGYFQDKTIGTHQPSPFHMMSYVNLWASVFLFIGLIQTRENKKVIHTDKCFVLGIYFTSGFSSVIGFCKEFPQVIWKIAWFALASSLGQIFIYFTVFQFGSLLCSLVTTTRKFFTILFSVVLFGHPLSVMQWVGVLVVFCGLGIETFSHQKKKKTE